MAENINISFAPNKNADEAQRIADIENYLQTLTERTKFALSTIIENYNETDDNKTSQLKQNIALQSVSDSVGKFTNSDKNCEIFNDYANNVAQAYYSHAEGYKTSATAPYTHSEGSETVASAPYAHAEGYMTQATAPSTHAEGSGTTASQNNAHSEGINTQANGYASHAEGENTVASGACSHAEGINTIAEGAYSHAEGQNCKVINSNTHAGGYLSEAIGQYSFTHGYGVKISNTCGTGFGVRNKTQNALFVIGNGGWWEGDENGALTLGNNANLWIEGSFDASVRYGGLGISGHGAARFGDNWTSDSTDTLLAVGNGYDSERPRDALTLDKNGNLYISGKLTAGGGIDIPIATAESVGCVKIGDNVTVADDGTRSVDLSTYLQSADIADWAKQPEKPVYTADEVGAAAEQHTHSTADITDFPVIPTKVSELQNDSGYISGETDPTVPDWAKQPVKPTYTASEVGAATADDISAAINGIEIGGRNYLLNTKTFSAASSTALSGALLSGAANLSEETYYGLSVRGGTLTTTQMEVCRYNFKYFELGDTFTFSFFAKGNITELRVFFYGYTGYVQVAKCVNSQGETNTNADGRCSFTVSDGWKRYWARWTLKTTGDTTIPKWILIRAYNAQVGQEIYICGCKLEKGNVNTDWSPDPEDYYSLAERVSALEAAALAGGE